MPDNKENRGERDRSRIDTSEPYELNYIAQKLGVSKEQILGAVAEVGNSREKVEEYIRNKPNNK